MQPAMKSYLTPEEYLAFERQSETKNEYLNDEIFAMAGASRGHNVITLNIASALLRQLQDRPCEIYSNDMRVKVQPTGLYAYPDVAVACGRIQFEDDGQDTLLNPTVIIEILSPTTESYDRGLKFAHYRRLESLTDYLLVWQTEARIEHFIRQPTGQWLLGEYQGLETVLRIDSVGCELQLAAIYAKVAFPSERPFSLRIIYESQPTYDIEGETHARRPPSPPNSR